MNYFKVKLTKRKGFSRTRAIVISMMAVTVFFCGSCDLIENVVEVADADFEPNDSRSEAYAVEQATVYNAFIAEADADFFSFTTTNGSTTFDEVEISVTNVASDLIIGVAVYDSQGELIGTSNTATGGADLTFTLLGLKSTDPYYVRFSGVWGDGWTVDGIGDHDTQGLYSFKVENLNANDEFAGNHSLNDAYAVERDQTYEGVLVSKYEADFFSFTTANGSSTYDEVEFSVTNVGSGLIIGAAIYNSAGELIATANSGGEGSNLTFILRDLQSDDPYYIRFSGVWGDGWTVEGIGDLYTRGAYSFQIRNLDANDDYAPNYSLNDAYSIVRDQTYNGVLVSKQEADFYAFTPTSENMQLQISNVGSDLTIGVAFYSPDFSLLGTGNAPNKGANYGINLTNLNTSLTYYLRFSGTWGDGWTVDGIGDHYSRGAYSFVLVDN